MSAMTESQPAERLRERLESQHPGWRGRLRVDTDGAVQTVALDVPSHSGHRLAVEISPSEARVSYHDGLPPGPAEKQFIWANDPLSDGIEAVCRFVEDLTHGHVVLVRRRLSRLIRFLRMDEAESLLSFVPAAELAIWSSRRRGAIVKSWTWDGP